MFDLLRQAKGSIETYTNALRTHVSNLNNSNTEGYKAIQYTFKSVFENTLNLGFGTTNNRSATNPSQLGGQGVLAEIRSDFSQGKLVEGNNLDIAISGNGLFPLYSPRERETVYSRNGRFAVSADSSSIVDTSNRNLLGWKIGSDGTPDTSVLVKMDITDKSDLGWSDDGILEAGFQAAADAVSFNESNPTATVTVPDVEQLYQLALVDFPNPSGLERVDGTAFRPSDGSGVPQNPALPGDAGLGSITGGSFESSNVFESGETIDALGIQRAMGASLSALQLVNKELQEIIQAIAS